MNCKCGCGAVTPQETRNRFSRGRVKGQHSDFIHGHNARLHEWRDRHTISSSGCWDWTGAKGDRGYGKARSKGKSVYAHRLYYARYRGAIAPGLVLDHLCRNHSCVNPGHLEAVTQAENLRRGRLARESR